MNKKYFLQVVVILLLVVMVKVPVSAEPADLITVTLVSGDDLVARLDDVAGGDRSTISSLKLISDGYMLTGTDFYTLKTMIVSGTGTLTYLDLSEVYCVNNEIPDNAFAKYGGQTLLLETIILPNSILRIGDSAFHGSTNLTCELVIPAGVTSIGSFAFYDADKVTGSLVIPDSVKTIGDHAFYHSAGFVNGTLTLGSGLETIGEFAFSQCEGFIGDLVIPDSVLTMDQGVFSYCSGFDGTLTIGSGLSLIADDAFLSCPGLTGTLVIPEGIMSIGDTAFIQNSGFTGVSFPSTLNTIGFAAFANCYNLTEVNIPDNVNSIGKNSFGSCIGLLSFSYHGQGITNADFNDWFNPSYFTPPLKTVDLSGAVNLSSVNFTGMTNLTNVTIDAAKLDFSGGPEKTWYDSYTGAKTIGQQSPAVSTKKDYTRENLDFNLQFTTPEPVWLTLYGTDISTLSGATWLDQTYCSSVLGRSYSVSCTDPDGAAENELDTTVVGVHSVSYSFPAYGAEDYTREYEVVTPDLTAEITPTEEFVQGRTASYTITVSNTGEMATSGEVTLTDILPAGLTATDFSGDGWTTDLSTLTATRSDVLNSGQSYPVLTLTVDVALDTPESVENRVEVSGGNDGNLDNNLTSYSTAVVQRPTVQIGSSMSSPTDTAPIPITITFSEVVSGFEAADLMVGNGIFSNFSGSETSYTADITPDAQGDVTMDIAAGAAQSAGGYDNKAAEQFVINYDVPDSPVISSLDGDSVTFIEGAAPVFLDLNSDTAVTDPDPEGLTGGELRVSITSGGVSSEDVLAVYTSATSTVSLSAGMTVGSQVAVEENVIGTISANGSSGNSLIVDLNSSVTVLSAQQLIRSLTYLNSNTADPIDGAREIEVYLQDGTTAAGTAVNTSVEVEPVNDPPSIFNLNGDNASTYIDQVVGIDVGGDAEVNDVDSPDYNGGYLTITYKSGVANGYFSVDGTTVTAWGDGTIGPGETVQVGGVSIGTVHSTYDGQGGNPLEINFNSASSTPGRISTLLQNLRYSVPSDIGNREFTLTISNGDGVINSGEESLSVPFTISVISRPPVIYNLDGDIQEYVEGSSPVLLDTLAAATLADGDDPPHLNGGQLHVSIISGKIADEDILSLDTSGAISLAGTTAGSNVSVSGTIIGTLINNLAAGNDLGIHFNYNATLARVTALLQAVTYENINNVDPVPADRSIQITVSDGHGGSGAVNTTVVFTPVKAPTLSATGADLVFTEGGPAVSLFSGATVSTVEVGQSIERITLTVTNLANGADEILGIDDTAVVLTNGSSGTTDSGYAYSVALSGSTATITVGETLSTVDTQTMLDGITYYNTSDVPSVTPRTVTITSIKDSGGTANGGVNTTYLTVESRVTLNAINDAPALTATRADPVFIEDGGAVSLFSGTVVDTVESGQDISEITLTVADLANGTDEILSIDGTAVVLIDGSSGTTDSGYAYSVALSGSTATITVGGTLSTVDTQTMLDGITYYNTSDVPSVTPRTVTITSIKDSGGTANGGVNTTIIEVGSTVIVNAVNDAPYITAPDSITLNEDETCSLADIRIHDVDGGTDRVSATFHVDSGFLNNYGVTTISMSSYLSFIHSMLDDISYIGADDTNGNFTLTIDINDNGYTGSGGPKSAVLNIPINITPVNDAPTDITLSSSTVAENTQAGSEVAVLSTADVDLDNEGDAFSYELVAGIGDTDNSSFTIAGDGGDSLRLAFVPNYEAKSSYCIRVRTTDSGGLTYEKQFTISILDVNEAPTGIYATLNVDENISVDTHVGTFATSDEDAGDTTFSYELVAGEGSGDNASFSIDGDSLITAAILNFEDKYTCSIRVRATDSGGLNFEKQFTVTINDINEPPTDIALSDSTIDENCPVGSEIGTFSTTDEDVDELFSYELVAGTGDTDNSSFTIAGSGGDSLKLAVVPNYEVKDSYSIRVRTTDSGGLTYEKQFTISILDENDAPTGLALSGSTIDENSPVGSEIGTFSTTYEDAGELFSYELVAGTGDTDNSSFTIAGGGGDSLKLAVVPNYENKDSYNIRVRTIDSGGLSFEEQFVISISDVNDAPTDIALSNSTIDENSPVGSEIGTISTIDEDTGDTNFSYELVGGDGSEDNDCVNIAGGSLQLAIVPNYEVKDSYSIHVRTTDSGGLSFEKQFVISITDINDDIGPVTDSNPMGNEVPEVTVNGTLVGVTASSVDEDTADTVTYSLTNDAGGRFTIDSDTGVVSVSGTDLFDYETSSTHSITVLAESSDSSNSTADFLISVVNVAEVVAVNLPSDGLYGIGEALAFMVNFDKPVLVDSSLGTPYLELKHTGGSVQAVYLSGSGTNTLVFQYLIQNGDHSSDGLEVGLSIMLNGGIINDDRGNEAVLTLDTGDTSGIMIDGIAPVLNSLSSEPADSFVSEGDLVTITAVFSELMAASPTITITNGGVSGALMTNSGDSLTWTYNWNVPAGNTNADITVAGTDTAGNPYVGDERLTFTLDDTAPLLTFINPTEGQEVNVSTGSMIMVDLLDSGSGVDQQSVEIRIDSGEWQIPTSTTGNRIYYLLNQQLEAGDHTVSIRVSDQIGNVVVQTVTFSWDNYREGFGFGRFQF